MSALRLRHFLVAKRSAGPVCGDYDILLYDSAESLAGYRRVERSVAELVEVIATSGAGRGCRIVVPQAGGDGVVYLRVLAALPPDEAGRPVVRYHAVLLSDRDLRWLGGPPWLLDPHLIRRMDGAAIDAPPAIVERWRRAEAQCAIEVRHRDLIPQLPSPQGTGQALSALEHLSRGRSVFVPQAALEPVMRDALGQVIWLSRRFGIPVAVGIGLPNLWSEPEHPFHSAFPWAVSVQRYASRMPDNWVDLRTGRRPEAEPPGAPVDEPAAASAAVHRLPAAPADLPLPAADAARPRGSLDPALHLPATDGESPRSTLVPGWGRLRAAALLGWGVSVTLGAALIVLGASRESAPPGGPVFAEPAVVSAPRSEPAMPSAIVSLPRMEPSPDAPEGAPGPAAALLPSGDSAAPRDADDRPVGSPERAILGELFEAFGIPKEQGATLPVHARRLKREIESSRRDVARLEAEVRGLEAQLAAAVAARSGEIDLLERERSALDQARRALQVQLDQRGSELEGWIQAARKLEPPIPGWPEPRRIDSAGDLRAALDADRAAVEALVESGAARERALQSIVEPTRGYGFAYRKLDPRRGGGSVQTAHYVCNQVVPPAGGERWLLEVAGPDGADDVGLQPVIDALLRLQALAAWGESVNAAPALSIRPDASDGPGGTTNRVEQRDLRRSSSERARQPSK